MNVQKVGKRQSSIQEYNNELLLKKKRKSRKCLTEPRNCILEVGICYSKEEKKKGNNINNNNNNK